MKLATLKEGGRDGSLLVVSKDLTRAVRATGIAATLLAAMENWDTVEPKLQTVYAALNAGTASGSFPFRYRHPMTDQNRPTQEFP